LVQSGRKTVSKSELSNFDLKHGLKRQSGIKLPVKPTWSEKMTVLSTFLESLLNFLSNNIKKLRDWVQSGRKAVSKFELTETQFERTVNDKIAAKTHLK